MGGWGQRFTGLARRTRLHHYRLRRIGLLRKRGAGLENGAEENGEKAGAQQGAIATEA